MGSKCAPGDQLLNAEVSSKSGQWRPDWWQEYALTKSQEPTRVAASDSNRRAFEFISPLARPGSLVFVFLLVSFSLALSLSRSLSRSRSLSLSLLLCLWGCLTPLFGSVVLLIFRFLSWRSLLVGMCSYRCLSSFSVVCRIGCVHCVDSLVVLLSRPLALPFLFAFP